MALGMTPEIENNANSFALSWRRCPMYEGLRMAGLDHATIEAMCKCSTEAGYAAHKKVFPQLSGALKFRVAPDQPCVEEFTLTEAGV
jgi:hypothetical protein